jgi:hypothetical protein
LSLSVNIIHKLVRSLLNTGLLRIQEPCVLVKVELWLLLTWFILLPWRWKQHIPSNCLLNSTELHGVTSQKIVHSSVATFRTRSLTKSVCLLKY